LRPIRKGDRGAAVEDVQRRLIVLGADLGPTGVDGVFLGATCAAVQTFQRDHHLDENGEVGPETWVALVDATFALGDRLLYLRFPYLHGQDVRTLQGALNSLGFACGDADGIFGAYTERAVRDFQVNTGLGADGIAGLGTVRALEGLKHVWAAKSQALPAEVQGAPARSASLLRDVDVLLVCVGATDAVAEHLVNLARASEPDARVRCVSGASPTRGALVIELTDDRRDGRLGISASEGGEKLSRTFGAAVASATPGGSPVVVLVEDPPRDEHALQSLAVALLDGLCFGLEAFGRPVLP
jgi:peptidoglycan hydrolase-like protein with peptidoglycan-binding domain